MQIVGKDNLARESISDFLWIDGIPNNEHVREFAQKVVNRLNKGLRDDGTYFVLVEDTYKLYKFEP